jgi:hypothetical protein
MGPTIVALPNSTGADLRREAKRRLASIVEAISAQAGNWRADAIEDELYHPSCRVILRHGPWARNATDGASPRLTTSLWLADGLQIDISIARLRSG